MCAVNIIDSDWCHDLEGMHDMTSGWKLIIIQMAFKITQNHIMLYGEFVSCV